MMIWICPECRYENEEEDWTVADFRCENCSKPIDEKRIEKRYWEVKPENYLPPDPRHLC